MGFSLIALIFFQWQWITTAVDANEDRFQQDVMSSMIDVVKKLEKQEVLELINRQMRQTAARSSYQNRTAYSSRQESVSFFYQWADTALQDINFSVSVDPFGNITYETNDSYKSPSIEHKEANGPIAYQSQTADGIKVLEDTVAELKASLEQLAAIEASQLRKEEQMIQQTLQKMNSKSQLLVTVLEEMMYSRPIEFRIAPEVIDSLLSAALHERGIDLPFEFGVWKPSPLIWFAGQTQNHQKEIIESEYSVNLFPNDLYDNTQRLSMIFPSKDQYLSGKIWFNMASSGVLLLVILGSFGYSVFTILRQKKLSEMKNDFINNMTHEFKTPIATIGLAVEALQDQALAGIPNIRERYIGVIGDENKRLGNQVEKVLQMAIVDRKELQLNKEPTDLHEVIEKAVSKISLQLENRQGEIQLALEEQPLVCLIDSTQVMHVLLNLLDNSIKYSEDAPKILIRTAKEKNRVTVSVKDHGIGMSKEAQKHIFQSFYRVSTGNLHDVKGFGLGLSFVKNIIDEHHGEIFVESDPGKGTKITFTIPMSHHA